MTPDISSKNSPILLIKRANRLNTILVMANLPADFKNLSPFADSKKAKGSDKGSPAIMMLGMLGILAVIALVFCALTLKAS